MKFWPSENLLFVTALEEAEVLQRMQKMLRGRDATYEGKITGGTFHLQRIISYRSSFLPVITGTIERGAGETMIWVKMRLHTFVLVFLGLWLAVFIPAGGFAIRYMIVQQEIKSPSFVPLIMLVGVYLMTLLGFKFESSRAKRDFQTIFQAKMQEL